MRGTRLGGAIVGVVLLFAFVGCGEEVVFLNGATLSLTSPAVAEGGRLFVPLLEFAPLLGAEARIDGTPEMVTIRWSDGRTHIAVEPLPSFHGVRYVSLDWLAELTGAELHRIGDAVHIETTVSRLTAFDVRDDRVTIRLDGFAPLELLPSQAARVNLRFRHCCSDVPPRSIVLADGPIAQADLLPQAGDTCVVSLWLREESAWRIERLLSEGFSALAVTFDGEPAVETVTELRPGWEFREIEPVLPGSTGLGYAYAHIENWRANYRLQPVTSPLGLGTAALLQEIQQHVGGELAVALDDSACVLVSGGTPIRLGSEPSPLLEFDVFGRSAFSTPDPVAVLRVAGRTIPLDGVNEPLAYGRIIAYTPGHSDKIALGIPGSFTVLKIRQGRVVSVYEGAFVFEDPTATLVVASGEARPRVSVVDLGDRASVECMDSVSGRSIVNAVGISSVLIRNARSEPDEGITDDGPAAPCAWTVLAMDWHGGLYVLCVPRQQPHAVCTRSDIQTILSRLPVPIRDAAVLCRSGAAAFLIEHRSATHVIGDAQRVSAALCLVPIE